MVTPDRLLDEFPAPTFRGAQKAALQAIGDALTAGTEVVLVRAPTGSGKSLLARAVMGAARTAAEAGPLERTGAYYTTPQVSQLDAVDADPLLSDLAVIRGKANYTCLLPGETDTPVNRAPCARERGFDCSVKHKCPYFSDREIASNRRFAAMTLAYFMRTAGSDVFGPRDVLVIDEAHGLAEWAEMYATIELDDRTVPVWEEVSVPTVSGLEDAATFAESLANVCRRRLDVLRRAPELDPAEAAVRDRLEDRVRELDWFTTDARDLDSATEWLVDQEDDGSLTITPVNPARYLHHTVWDRADTFVLLSATILDATAFARSVGLDPDRVTLVDVPHTFPLDHRPLFDVTQGRMTFNQRDETLPAVARLLVRLMARHPDEKGIVHAHSYAIKHELDRRLREMGVGSRVLSHDRDDRDAALAGWLAAEEPAVFLSVTMEEALDLEGDQARWQVLCKAPYPNTHDPRVAHRLADDQWAWYYRSTLSTVIQACGRVVRSADDHGATYLADSSLHDLFERARGDMPAWFADQVDAMTTPALPDFDPAAAVSGMEADPAPAPRTDRSTRPANASGRAEEGEARAYEDHPLSDIWGN